MEKRKRRRLSARERKRIFDMYGGRCAYCGTGVTFRGMQIDHKKPLRIGGEDTQENLLPACRSCNSYKHSLDVEEFRDYLKGIPKRLSRDSIAYRVGKRFELLQESETEVKFYFEKMGEKEK